MEFRRPYIKCSSSYNIVVDYTHYCSLSIWWSLLFFEIEFSFLCKSFYSNFWFLVLDIVIITVWPVLEAFNFVFTCATLWPFIVKKFNIRPQLRIVRISTAVCVLFDWFRFEFSYIKSKCRRTMNNGRTNEFEK